MVGAWAPDDVVLGVSWYESTRGGNEETEFGPECCGGGVKDVLGVSSKEIKPNHV